MAEAPRVVLDQLQQLQHTLTSEANDVVATAARPLHLLNLPLVGLHLSNTKCETRRAGREHGGEGMMPTHTAILHNFNLSGKLIPYTTQDTLPIHRQLIEHHQPTWRTWLSISPLILPCDVCTTSATSSQAGLCTHYPSDEQYNTYLAHMGVDLALDPALCLAHFIHLRLQCTV